jgi:uncharacterized protein involved in response to NO
MQIPPLSFSDLSLLLALGAIILLITAELASSYYGHTKLIVNKERLRNAALIIGIIFLFIVATRVINIVTTS